MIVTNFKSEKSKTNPQTHHLHKPYYSLLIINYSLNYGDYHHEYT